MHNYKYAIRPGFYKNLTVLAPDTFGKYDVTDALY